MDKWNKQLKEWAWRLRERELQTEYEGWEHIPLVEVSDLSPMTKTMRIAAKPGWRKEADSVPPTRRDRWDWHWIEHITWMTAAPQSSDDDKATYMDDGWPIIDDLEVAEAAVTLVKGLCPDRADSSIIVNGYHINGWWDRYSLSLDIWNENHTWHVLCFEHRVNTLHPNPFSDGVWPVVIEWRK